MLRKLALLVIVLLLAIPGGAEEQKKPKDTLVIAMSTDFEPFTFLNAEGKPAGMFVDIWRLWAEKTGKQIEFISSDWKRSLENLKNKKADIHSGLLLSGERFDWMAGSQPFYEVGVSLFYPLKQGKIHDIKELSGQTIAVVSGSHAEQFVKANYPGIRVLARDTREELLNVSREGKARGFVANSPVGASVLDRMGLYGEFETYDKILYREGFRAGVLKTNVELLAIVDRGLRSISNNELADIEARWIPDQTKRYFRTSNMIRLTAAEEAWLKGHKTIRVGMAPIFPPLKFSEKGVIKGIEPDYLQLLSEYTGIKFEYVVGGLPGMDARVKSGTIDMFISFYIPERLAYMTFTEPLMEFKQVIIARNDAQFLSGLGALKGKKIATVRGVKLYNKILASYPDLEAVEVDTMDEMFKAVSEFKADALISKTYFAGYVMQNYPNLRIAGIADLPPEPYYYAVRKDYPELVSILNKAIVSISQESRDAIVQKWFSVRFEYRPNWAETIKWVSVIAGVLILSLGLSLFWNRRLANEVNKRKRTEEALLYEKERFATLSGNAPFGMVSIDAAGNIVYVNPKFTEISGYRLEDVPDGKTWFRKAYPDPEYRHTVIAAWIEDLKEADEGGKRHRTFTIACKDGTKKVISFIPVPLRTGEHLISCDDVTEQKFFEDKLHALSIIDDLTGVHNRRGFFTLSEQQLKVAERSEKHTLLLFADLDRMKDINDTLGHHEGDRALIQVSQVLKETFRESDIIGRIGGDEFAVLVIDALEETQETVMQRLHNALEARNRLEGRTYSISLSVGIAHYDPDNPSSLDELMTKADTLMYEDKRKKQL